MSKRDAKTPTTGVTGRKPTPRSPRARAPLAVKPKTAKAEVSPTERAAMIASAAYFKAEERDFVPGHEVEDWISAEQDIEIMVGR